MNRGTKIIIHLKDEDKRFSLKATVEGNREKFQLIVLIRGSKLVSSKILEDS